MNHASDTLTLHNGVEMPLLGLGGLDLGGGNHFLQPSDIHI